MNESARERKQRKREEAQARAAARALRGDKGQLERLEANGHGYGKEADRLRAKLAKEAKAKKS
jgi:hypothetical protein